MTERFEGPIDELRIAVLRRLHREERWARTEPPRYRRVAAGLVLVAHGIVLWLWVVASNRLPVAEDEPGLRVEWVPAAPLRETPAIVPGTRVGAEASVSEVAPVAPSSDRASVRPPPEVPATQPTPEPRLRGFAPDGRWLDDGWQRPLVAAEPAAPQFSFRIPGLDGMQQFERPPAIAYEATRFDRMWVPPENLVEEWLRRSIREVRLPIPGLPGNRIVCSMSLLLLIGGCVVVRNDDLDGDPEWMLPKTSLTPEEEARCQDWWNRIVEPQGLGQAEHRRLREDYIGLCGLGPPPGATAP